jgi:hypothetical protein
MKREDVVDQIKRWWPLAVSVFLLGGSWATATYQIKELEKRVSKMEGSLETLPDLKADVKALTRESWRRGEKSKQKEN